MRATPRRLTLALAVLLAAGTVAAGAREDVRAEDAVRVVKQIQAIPESAIPDRLLDEAKAIVVVPDTLKAGFMIGGRRGLGDLEAVLVGSGEETHVAQVPRAVAWPEVRPGGGAGT